MGPIHRVLSVAAAVLIAVAVAIAGLATLCGTGGCSRQPSAGRAPGPLRVVVTVAPLAGLTRPLLPEGASLSTLIAPGHSEHGYELTARDIATLAKADVVVYVGLALEPQVEEFLRKHPEPGRRVVCFADAAGLNAAAAEHHEEPGHDDHDADDDGHHHGRIDPHLWLDPGLCEKLVPPLAAAIRDRLQGIGQPQVAATVDAAQAKELADIRALDAELRAKLAPLAGRPIVTHHAAWGRFAERYGLKVAAVIRPIETTEPSNSAINAAVKAVQDQGARAIFVEPQFSDTVAARIAKEAGAKLGHLDPLGDGDWFKLMRSNADALVNTLAR